MAAELLLISRHLELVPKDYRLKVHFPIFVPIGGYSFGWQDTGIPSESLPYVSGY